MRRVCAADWQEGALWPPSLLLLMFSYEQPLAWASCDGEMPEPCSLTRTGRGESACVGDRRLPDVKLKI